MMTRKEEIQEAVRTYITKYTCGMMADRLADMQAETAAADDALFLAINKLGITKDELEEAVNAEAEDRANRGTACCYARDLFSTRFFRG
jgi:hypothetical protein